LRAEVVSTFPVLGFIKSPWYKGDEIHLIHIQDKLVIFQKEYFKEKKRGKLNKRKLLLFKRRKGKK
jgi:hypothetical protein